jgi:hypothetical protein
MLYLECYELLVFGMDFQSEWNLSGLQLLLFFNKYSSFNSFGCCSNPLDHLFHDYWCFFAMSFLHVMFVNFWCWNRIPCQNGSRGLTWDCMKVENLCTLLNFGVRHCCDYLWAWSSSSLNCFWQQFYCGMQILYTSSDSDISKKLHSNWPSCDRFLSKMVEIIQLSWTLKLNVLQSNFLKGALHLVKFQQPQHGYTKLGSRLACSGPCKCISGASLAPLVLGPMSVNTNRDKRRE